MRITAAIAGIGILGTLASAAAEDTVTLPDAYLIGKSSVPLAPSRVESATAARFERQAGAALDGAFYAEIFPIFNEGANGNTSYIRFGAGAHASTFHVIVLGSPSGNKYGEADIQVQANASPQYPIGTVLTSTSAGALANGDTAYALYLSNTADDAFYQHVIFNGTNLFFEDLTVCPSGSSIQGGRTLTNVHSTLLSGYPSTIYIHNMQSIDATYTVKMRDSATGTLLGTLASLSVPANSTFAVPESYFETQLHVTPTSSQAHMTFEFHATSAFALQLGSDPDPVDVGAVFSSTVKNNQYNAVLNLSNKCTVNR